MEGGENRYMQLARLGGAKALGQALSSLSLNAFREGESDAFAATRRDEKVTRPAHGGIKL